MSVSPTVPRPVSLPWLMAALTGVPLLLLGLLLLSGSMSDVWLLLFLSVVCTAGIGLAFWLGLATLLGLAALYVCDQLLRTLGHPKGTGLFDGAGGLAAQHQRQRTLEHYLARRLAMGVDPVRVRQELIGAGWSETQLQQAFLTLRQR